MEWMPAKTAGFFNLKIMVKEKLLFIAEKQPSVLKQEIEVRTLEKGLMEISVEAWKSEHKRIELHMQFEVKTAEALALEIIKSVNKINSIREVKNV